MELISRSVGLLLLLILVLVLLVVLVEGGGGRRELAVGAEASIALQLVVVGVAGRRLAVVREQEANEGHEHLCVTGVGDRGRLGVASAWQKCILIVIGRDVYKKKQTQIRV